MHRLCHHLGPSFSKSPEVPTLPGIVFMSAPSKYKFKIWQYSIWLTCLVKSAPKLSFKKLRRPQRSDRRFVGVCKFFLGSFIFLKIKYSIIPKNDAFSKLKGQCHEIFDPRFFLWINSKWVPDTQAITVLNINSYSQRYSKNRVFPRWSLHGGNATIEPSNRISRRIRIYIQNRFSLGVRDPFRVDS